MVVEIQPPCQAVSSVMGPDAAADTHSSTSSLVSEMSKPLRVTMTFVDATKSPSSLADVQVNFHFECH